MQGESSADTTKRVNVWSGPRNISTALMYSFAQRADTRVVDEPLYAYYLRTSGVEHPGRDEVLGAMDSDATRVVRDVILGTCDRPVLFLKQMAHHLEGVDRSFLALTDNVLLIREPSEVLLSLRHQIPHPELRDTGFAALTELFDELDQLGQNPPIVDSRELLLDPEGVLEQLCVRLEIAFEPSMLSWEPGARPEDGVWAPHWYASLHRSTGFRAYQAKSEPLPAELESLLEECRPHYDRLFERALMARR